MVRVKICGVSTIEDALLAIELGADAIGLNFYDQSPRCISPFTAGNITRQLPPFVSPVGVFVNWEAAPVIALAAALRLSAVQLHGDESPKLAAEIAKKIPVIKAFRLAEGTALPAFSKYQQASAFLLDAAAEGQFGGTGRQTDWHRAQSAGKSNRIILAGGLTPENVAEAIRVVGPYAVDVASGVESKPGKKDPGKLRAFFSEVSRANESLLETENATQGKAKFDPFVGRWELDPSTLDYQSGRPGRRAIYQIEQIPEGFQFHLDGDDADGKPMKFSYGGPLDGIDKPIPNSDAALALTRLDKHIIESTLKRDGKVVDRWTRELLPDGQSMKIVQHVVGPDGKKFLNTSVYRRTN
jgi:phosphoribosylanthranilate isomerase